MIAVTGATGLIGSHLTYALLKRNQSVLALSTHENNFHKIKQVFKYYNDDFEKHAHQLKFEICDVLDIWQLEAIFQGVDTVYHCAALVSFAPKDKERMFKINAEGTANVVNAAMANEVKRFCYVSSVATLNNPDFKLNIDESVVWKSTPEQSNYTISKYMAEREVWRAFEEGLNGVIVNPSIVLGPIESHQSSAQLVLQAKRGIKFYTGGSSGFVDVRDVAAAAIALVDNQKFGQRFILNGFNSSYEALFSKLNVLFGHKAPTIFIPKWLLKLVAPVSRLLSKISKSIPIIHQENIQSAYHQASFNNDKVSKNLNMKFMAQDETLKWLHQSNMVNRQ
jgi:dihydroflavonol-4-reductase